MGIPELRQELHNFINHADTRILRMMYSLANEYSKEDDVVYCGKKSMTIEQLLSELKDAEAEIQRGECQSIEEFAKESEKWV
jgi:vacuolar-type H+-ATPase subunit E/Vma4